MNRLLETLHSGAQGASNAAASAVSGPVDMISWALRKSGVPLPANPVGGSNWMGERGLTQEPKNRLAGLIGEGVGMALPGVVASRAPEIAGGMIRGVENIMKPRTQPKELGGVLVPRPQSNYYKDDLSEYTPNVFRETDIEGLSQFGKNSMSSPKDLWFANQPEYALGQGANKGVTIEFSTKNMPGKLELGKPGAAEAYDRGYAEFMTKAIDPAQLADNVLSVKVTPGQQKGPYWNRMVHDLTGRGFVKEVMPDKSVVFKRPE